MRRELFPRFVYFANYPDGPSSPYSQPRYFETKRLAEATFGRDNVVRYRRDDTRASKRKRRSGE